MEVSNVAVALTKGKLLGTSGKSFTRSKTKSSVNGPNGKIIGVEVRYCCKGPRRHRINTWLMSKILAIRKGLGLEQSKACARHQ
jgi:hypothetical protein